MVAWNAPPGPLVYLGAVLVACTVAAARTSAPAATAAAAVTDDYSVIRIAVDATSPEWDAATSAGLPMVITGLSSLMPAQEEHRSMSPWADLAAALSRDVFLSEYGDTLVENVPGWHVANFGPQDDSYGRSTPQTLRQALGASLYFGRTQRLTHLVLNSVAARRWLSSSPVRQRSPFNKFDERILSVGTEGQGLPFHRHGATLLTLVTGSKDWWVAPPTHEASPPMLW